MKRTEFWARGVFYNPWVMGGSVWEHKRYRLSGTEVRVWGHQGYVSKVGREYEVFEGVSGGLIGKGKTKSAAVKDAVHNIRITPTLKRQIEDLGSVNSLQEVPTEEALRRLKKYEEKA